jgi:hypothetical protein
VVVHGVVLRLVAERGLNLGRGHVENDWTKTREASRFIRRMPSSVLACNKPKVGHLRYKHTSKSNDPKKSGVFYNMASKSAASTPGPINGNACVRLR